MNKKLEALKLLKANAILFDDGTDFGASMLEAISDIEQEIIDRQETENSLTQWVSELTKEIELLKKKPTADEVCEHLNKSFGLNIHNTDLHFIYDKESKEFRMVSQNAVYRYISTKRQSDDSIKLIDLNIDDIVILDRFYKGLE